MAQRRGFTLVEVLVALGLLVLIASLALPVALTNTAGARSQTATRMLTLAPAVARGEAQRLGLPVALVLLPGEDGAALGLAVVREPDPESGRPADERADPQDVATWPAVDEPRALPEGTRLWTGDLTELEAMQADRAAEMDAAGGSVLDAALGGAGDPLAGEAAALEATPGMAPEGARAVVLAWFLSDGSALTGQAAAVRLADGRIVRLRVAPLVGSVELDFQSAAEAAGDGGDGGDGGDSDATEAPDARDPGAPAMDEPASGEAQFEARAFEARAFEARAFDELGFDELGFDELDGRAEADRPAPARRPARGTTDDERGEGPSPADEDDTNPQPPQPR